MFFGSLVAIVSPFDESGIDICAFKSLIDQHILAGTNGIVVCGTTGEGSLVSDIDRATLIDVAITHAQDRIPIIVGCTAASTEHALHLTKEAELKGADGVLIMTPYCVKPTQKGIFEHFKTIHDQTNIPIIIYNHPGRSGVDIAVDTLVDLFKLDRIVALKDSNPDMERPKALLPFVKGTDKTLLSGDDPTVMDYLKEGGSGCISVTANIVPKQCADIMYAFKEGDFDKASCMNKDIAPLHFALGCETNPQPVKYALYKMGFIKPIIKLPLLMSEGKNAQIIDNALSLVVNGDI
ncbi:MAG: 4-hydroxy-tetrahydrodipicolinate synthase [Holosporales bacterium]